MSFRSGGILLTHASEVPYDGYIQSLTGNRIAIEVKIADLEDNMDIRRSQEVDDEATLRFRKYLAAYLQVVKITLGSPGHASHVVMNDFPKKRLLVV